MPEKHFVALLIWVLEWTLKIYFLCTTKSLNMNIFLPLRRANSFVFSRDGRKQIPPALRHLISRALSSGSMCLWGAEAPHTRSYKQLAKTHSAKHHPADVAEGVTAVRRYRLKQERIPVQSPKTWKLPCWAVRKSTPVAQGAQLEHSRRPLGGGCGTHWHQQVSETQHTPKRLWYAPFSQRAGGV